MAELFAMEHLPCSSSLRFGHVVSALLLVVVPVVVLFKLLRDRDDHHKRRRRENAPRLPPGPWRLPVIGSLHHLVGAPLMHRAMADLARRCDAPVMYLRLGELPAVVISSPDAAREVMKTHDVTFATRPLSLTVRATAADGLGIVFEPYGERWRRLRRICALELLGAPRVRSFRPIREDEATRLAADVAACPPGAPVNVSARVATLVTDAALRAMMGERFRRRDEFLEALAQAVKIVAGFNVGDLFPSSWLVCAVGGTVRKAKAFRRKIFELVDEAIAQHEERRAEAGATADAVAEDLLDVLLRIQKEGGVDCPLAMGTIKAVILDLFAAGSETTSTAILWAMAELMRNPTVTQKAQAELRHVMQGKSMVTEDDLINLQYLKLVIKETLRLHPAVPLLVPRECRESCKILGYDVPKGAFVLVNAWAIGRDPRHWEEPEVFKPERFEEEDIDFKGSDFRYIPFGAGRRICPGMAFAQPNMELVLATLLFHFDWQLPAGIVPRELDMTEEMGISVRRKKDLLLHPTIIVPPALSQGSSQ
ncbi:hypothetical protein ACP4OV_014171 [Aristida adscensionis]